MIGEIPALWLVSSPQIYSRICRFEFLARARLYHTAKSIWYILYHILRTCNASVHARIACAYIVARLVTWSISRVPMHYPGYRAPRIADQLGTSVFKLRLRNAITIVFASFLMSFYQNNIAVSWRNHEINSLSTVLEWDTGYISQSENCITLGLRLGWYSFLIGRYNPYHTLKQLITNSI